MAPNILLTPFLCKYVTNGSNNHAITIPIKSGEIMVNIFPMKGSIFQSLNNLLQIKIKTTIERIKNIFNILTPILIPSFNLP